MSIALRDCRPMLVQLVIWILERKKISFVCNVFHIATIKYQVVFRKEIWIMDPAADQYYRWLSVIAGPVFYNLIMIVTRCCLVSTTIIFLNTNISLLIFASLSCSRASFNELQSSYTKLWIVLDYTSDIIYYMDTFVRSRTGPNSGNV